MPLSRITSASIANSAISAADIADGTITAVKIISVANTQITGNIVSSQITSVGGSQITANTIANSAFQTGSVENYMNAAGLGFGMRNRIINGAMVIDQRNAGASVTPANGDYTLDRIKVATTQASKFTVQQNAGAVTPPSGFKNYLGVTSSSTYSVVSSDYFLIGQALEGFNTSDLGFGAASASTITLSFWVRSSLTGTFGGAINNSAYSRSYPFSYTVSTANTWEQKSVTIAGDTTGTWIGATNGVGLYAWFNLGTGSTGSTTANAWAAGSYYAPTGATSVVGTNGATFYITGVQLEKGSTATSFDYRPYGTELALCQRYFVSFGGNSAYEKFGTGMAYSTTSAIVSVNLPVQMRSNPTVLSAATLGMYTTGASINTATVAIDASSTLTPALGVTSTGLTAGQGAILLANNSTSARVQYSAEL